MKESIIVLFFFSFGVLGGRLDLLPADWLGLVHEPYTPCSPPWA